MSVKVLIADDDPSIVTMLAKLLKPLGVENPLTAEDGVEALRLFSRHEFDLVLVDWEMPRVSGLDVIKAIRATGCETPIVMITAKAVKSHVLEALEAGATDYVVKPFDPNGLRRKIGRLCKPMSPSVDATIYRTESVMNRDVLTIQEDATVAEAIEMLLEREFSGLPVVDREQRPVGVITELQLLRTICAPEMKQRPVADFMTTDVITATEETFLSELVAMMEEHRIRRIPVVRDGRVVGLVARRDLLRHAKQHEEAIADFLGIVQASGGV